ncbi:quinoprotein glucose dehydrogenase [Bacillus lacus]|uniref:Quinoprotein glucose dehydrogenase n=1 Tax=Metabacillus lacus TaxID=1983721 RepID=A0A7X2J1T5_9BACI|nr:PQQ-dependent sugar dehydrogenase [Metabacillus lacus]MRX73572.1 quinoprotein glucose dehydrogenase [Metabacillus lacus]
MKKKAIPLILTSLLLASCSQGGQQESEQSSEPAVSDVGPKSMIQNLDVPWAITKIGDTFYFPERTGSIVEWNSEEGTTSSTLSLTEDIHVQGEGGLLGFEPAADFAESQEAFLYHTYQTEDNLFNRIVLVKKEGTQWTEQSVLLDGIPGGVNHNGGRLKAGPDHKLYVTTGDTYQTELAQDVESLAGKILRLELNGDVPDDNPFGSSYVYSYGHRNPQGLAWDEDGNLYSSEHGQTAHDEINLIQPGKNYGWPEIEGDETQEGMESPIFHTGNDTWAPSGLAYHEGKLYVATLAGTSLKSYEIETGETEDLVNHLGRLRDVLIEENVLYTISNNRDGRGNPGENDDQLYRLELKRED